MAGTSALSHQPQTELHSPQQMVTISVLLEWKQIFSHLKVEENETEGKVGTALGWKQPCSRAGLAFRQEKVLNIHVYTSNPQRALLLDVSGPSSKLDLKRLFH